MQQLLDQINSLPGVIGSLVNSNARGVVAHAFPPLFDVSIIQEAARALPNVSRGLQGGDGPDCIDFRFADGRIIVRPLPSAQLLLLGTKELNTQVLNISLNVAVKKLEKMLSDSAADSSVKSLLDEQEMIPCGSDDELVLEVGTLVPAEANKGFEQLGMVAINQNTAHRISSYLGVGSLKKATLVNGLKGKEGVFPFMIVNDDESKYDGKLILGKGLEKKLQVEIGDKLTVKL